jgi:hypothetical protein
VWDLQGCFDNISSKGQNWEGVIEGARLHTYPIRGLIRNRRKIVQSTIYIPDNPATTAANASSPMRRQIDRIRSIILGGLRAPWFETEEFFQFGRICDEIIWQSYEMYESEYRYLGS